jgi:hypothetical protein
VEDLGSSKVRLPVSPVRSKVGVEIDLPEGCRQLDQYSGSAWSYFVSRGFTTFEISKYFVGYCSKGKYWGRIILPVINDNKLVSFVARDYTGEQSVKVRNPESVPHKSYLYNYDNLENHTAILTEGVFDCWRVGASGLATFGTSITIDQMLRLCKLPLETLYFCWDADAIDKAYEAAFGLTQFFPDIRVVELPGDHDPADLTREEVFEYIGQAKPVGLKAYVTARLMR